MHRPWQFPYGKRTKALAPMHLSPGCADCTGRGIFDWAVEIDKY